MENKIVGINQLITLSALVGFAHGGGSQDSRLLVQNCLSKAIISPTTEHFTKVATIICDIKT